MKLGIPWMGKRMVQVRKSWLNGMSNRHLGRRLFGWSCLLDCLNCQHISSHDRPGCFECMAGRADHRASTRCRYTARSCSVPQPVPRVGCPRPERVGRSAGPAPLSIAPPAIARALLTLTVSSAYSIELTYTMIVYAPRVHSACAVCAATVSGEWYIK